VNGGYRFVADNDIVGFNDTNFSGAFAEAKLKFGWSWGSSSSWNDSKKKKVNNVCR
jgi:hypothetical protein